jgi:transposase-like protein
MKYSEEEKAMWLEDWRQSGKSAWAYAKANGLNFQTFRQWTKPARETETGFVEVTPAKLAPTEILSPTRNHQEILIEKGDVRIHIPLSAGCGELRSVMEGLGRVL